MRAGVDSGWIRRSEYRIPGAFHGQITGYFGENLRTDLRRRTLWVDDLGDAVRIDCGQVGPQMDSDHFIADVRPFHYSDGTSDDISRTVGIPVSHGLGTGRGHAQRGVSDIRICAEANDTGIREYAVLRDARGSPAWKRYRGGNVTAIRMAIRSLRGWNIAVRCRPRADQNSSRVGP